MEEAWGWGPKRRAHRASQRSRRGDWNQTESGKRATTRHTLFISSSLRPPRTLCVSALKNTALQSLPRNISRHGWAWICEPQSTRSIAESAEEDYSIQSPGNKRPHATHNLSPLLKRGLLLLSATSANPLRLCVTKHRLSIFTPRCLSGCQPGTEGNSLSMVPSFEVIHL